MFDIFVSEKTKKQKSHLRNLAALSKIDGKVDDLERMYLYKIGEKHGFKPSEIDVIIEKADTSKIEIPTDKNEKVEQTLDLLELLNSDGEISEEELDFVTDYATKLGFKIEIVGVLVRKMAMEFANGKSREEIKVHIEPFLVY